MMAGHVSIRRLPAVVVIAALGVWGAGQMGNVAAGAPLADVCSWTRLADNVARTEHVMVALPPIDQAVIVYGGADSVQFAPEHVVSDTYRLSLGGGPPGLWSELPPSGTPAGPRAGHVAALRATNLGLEILTYGGMDGLLLLADGRPARDSSVAADRTLMDLDNTYALSPVGGWRRIQAENAAPRTEHAAVYWPARDALVVFGGRDPLSGTGVTSDTLLLDVGNAVPSWTTLPIEGGSPPARLGHTLVYDPLLDQAILYGGLSREGVPLGDVWTLNLGGDVPTWVAQPTEGEQPAARYEHSAVFLPGMRWMVVFGGTSDGNTPLGDLAYLDFSASPPRWATLSPEGEAPGPRFGAAAASPGDVSLVLYGGETGGEVLGDTWLLLCQSPEPTATPTASPTHTPTPPTPSPTGPLPTGSPTDTPTAPAELYVHGLVYDAADGPTHPVPTARVRVSPCVGAHQPFEDTSGDDGTYSVVLPGMYFFPGCTAHFEVIASGYVTGSWDIGYSDLISLPERDFGLQPEGQPTATPTQGPTNVEVHGLVYDAGQGPAWPIAGAQVVVPPCSTPHQSFSAVTGADGLYSLVLPAPYFELGCTLHFDVRAAGYQPLSVDVLYDDVVADPVRDFALAPEVGGRLYLPALQKGSQ